MSNKSPELAAAPLSGLARLLFRAVGLSGCGSALIRLGGVRTYATTTRNSHRSGGIGCGSFRCRRVVPSSVVTQWRAVFAMGHAAGGAMAEFPASERFHHAWFHYPIRAVHFRCWHYHVCRTRSRDWLCIRLVIS